MERLDKLIYLLIGLCVFSCTYRPVSIQPKHIEKAIFSEEEKKIINAHFKPDTTDMKIESVKIQTH